MANITVRPVSGTGTSWTNIARAYDTSTTTYAQVTGVYSSNYSQRSLTLTFSEVEELKNARIISATLTVVAKQSSATNNRRITVQVDINENSSYRVINTQLTDTNNTTLTANIASYISSIEGSGITNLKITPYTTGGSNYQTQTFSIYDVKVDVEYEAMGTKIAEYKFSNINTLEVVPTFNDGFKYITEDVVQGTTVTRTIYGVDLPTMCKFSNNPSELLEVLYLNTGNVNFTDMSYMFDMCTNLTYVNTDYINTSNVTNMSAMFNDCQSLTSLDLSSFITNRVTNMRSMFRNCNNLITIGDVSNWNTSNVTDMFSMFQACDSLISLDVSKWDTSNVTTMYAMFNDCYNLTMIKGIEKINTIKVQNTLAMFDSCYGLSSLNLSKWDTSALSNAERMFSDDNNFGRMSLKTLNLSNWKLDNVNITGIFSNISIDNITINNSNYNSINRLINELPTRTADSYGLLDVAGVNDFSQVNVTAAEAKFWNVENRFKVVEYKFDNTVYNLIPEFNESYQYTYEDIINDNVTTRIIYSNELPTLMNFGFRDDDIGNHGNADASSSLLEIISLRTDNLTTMGDMFRYCTSLTSINTKDWIINAADMSCMFEYCNSLIKIDLSNLDVSSVNTVTWMFASCENLTEVNLANWNTNNILDFTYMFAYCPSMVTIDISNWVLHEESVGSEFFYECNVNKILFGNMSVEDIARIDSVLHAEDIEIGDCIHTIYANNLTDQQADHFASKGWIVYSDQTLVVYAYDTMLADYYCPGGFDISKCEVKQLSVDNVKVVLINSKTEKPTSIKFGYSGNLDIAEFAHQSLTAIAHVKTDYITDMNCMFDDCINLEQLDTYGWNTSNVTDMYAMFWSCKKLTSLDVNHFDVSNVEDMAWLFGDCSLLTELDLSNWNTSKVTSLKGMFSRCINLVSVNVTGWDTSKVIDMYAVFGKDNAGGEYPGCDNLETIIGIEDWDVSNVDDMGWMFYGAYKLKALDLSKWNTSNVTDMSIMFCGAGMENSDFALNIKDWDVHNVFYTSYMFDCCHTLKELDLSGWDVSNITDMAWMFGNDDYNSSMMLKKLNLSGWKFNEYIYMPDFFTNTNKINEVIMNDSNYESVNEVISQLPERAANDPGLIQVYNINDISQVDTSAAKAKFWNVINEDENEIKIAEYKFDGSLYNLIPEFNEGFTYTYKDIVEGNLLGNTAWTYNRLIDAGDGRLIYSEPWPDAMTSDFIEVEPGVTYYSTHLNNNVENSEVNMLNYYWYDENKVYLGYENGFASDSSAEVAPLNAKYVRIVTDLAGWIREGWNENNVYLGTSPNSIITRTIYNDTLPTEIYFGNQGESNDFSNSLLEVEYICCNNLYWMASLFDWCENLTYVNATNWNTSNVVSMNSAFSGCTSLTELDLSNWDTSQVTDMGYMFYGCIGLKEINISGFNMNNVTTISNMLSETNALNSILMNASDYTSVNKVISQLLARTANSPGTLNITNDLSQINVIVAEDKYWNIISPNIIARYKFTNSSDVIPVFNDGFEYFIEDEYLDTADVTTTFTETMMLFNAGSQPDEYGVITAEEEITTYNTISADTIVTRTIYSNSLPTSISFQDISNLIEVNYLETSEMTSAYNLFYNCANLTYIDLRNSDFSNIETIERMFTSCTNLVTIDGLNDLDISKAHNMGGIFSDCKKLKEANVSNWDVSKITNFGAAFRRCYELTSIPIDNWDTSSAVLMSGVFTSCTKLTSIDVSNWSTNSVTTVNQMFYGCSKLTSVKLYNHLNEGVDTLYLFGNCNALNYVEILDSDYSTVNRVIERLPNKSSAASGTLNISGVDNISQVNVSTAGTKYWNIKQEYKVTEYKFDSSLYDLFPDFNEGFEYRYEDNYLDTEDINVTSIETIMIFNADSIPDEYGVLTTEYELENISTFSAENIVTRTIYSNELPTLMRFGDRTDKTNKSICLLDVAFANTSNITNMSYMFANCISLTSLNLNDWNTSKVNAMNLMFYGCTSLITLDISNWDTSNVINTSGMFFACYALESLDLSNWNTSKVTNMASMFNSCSQLVSVGNINNWNTNSLVDTNNMFIVCYNLTQLDLNNWDTSKVTDMNNMFNGCKSLAQLDVSNWDVSNVTNMNDMFRNCESLTSLDLTNWDASNVTNMSSMFRECNSLTKLDISNWDLNSVTQTTSLFDNTGKLNNIVMNNSDYNSINKVIAELPTRTADNKGTLDIKGIDNLDQVDIAAAQSKYWSVIGKYNKIIKISLGNLQIDSIFGDNNKRIKNIYLGDDKII